MEIMPISKAFTLIEPGPVVFVTTNDGTKNNIMTISWTMVVDFTPKFAITTGPWNHSHAALQKSKECVISIPTVDLLDKVVGVGTCSGADTDKFEKFEALGDAACYVANYGNSKIASSVPPACSSDCKERAREAFVFFGASTVGRGKEAHLPPAKLRKQPGGEMT